MFTAISPHEMTLDPEFHLRNDLADVGLPGLATRRITCSGQNIYTLPDAKMLLLSGSTVWPEFSDAMPYATRVEEFPLQGEPIVLVDHTALVYDELNRFNATQGPLDAAGTGGAVGVGMQGPNAGSSAQEDRDVTAAGGCACMAAGRRQSPFWGASVLALLWAASRRRRRQSG